MSPASSGPQPLGVLLSSALAFVCQYIKPILIGSVIFATLAALLGGGVSNRAMNGVNGMMNQMGLDSAQMENLAERIESGDETAMAEMEQLFNDRLGDMENGLSTQLKGQMLTMFLPLVGVAALVGLLIAVFSQAFFLLLALSPTQDAMVVLKKTPALFFPLLGLWIWTAIRSFIWIPILGLIPAIILGPRFVLGPVIMIKEKKGITQSVRESYARTSGYWGKIVGNMIVAVLCIILAGIVAAMIAGIAGAMIPFAGMWLQAVAKEVLSAFMAVFAVQLSLTIMSNPMGVVAPARATVSAPVAATKKKAAPKKKATRK